jgi:hypothetical protein
VVGKDGPVDGPLSCAKIPNDVPVDGTADVIILAQPYLPMYDRAASSYTLRNEINIYGKLEQNMLI